MTYTIRSEIDTPNFFEALKKFVEGWQGTEIISPAPTKAEATPAQKIAAAQKLCGILSHEEAEEIRNNRISFRK